MSAWDSRCDCNDYDDTDEDDQALFEVHEALSGVGNVDVIE